MPRNELSSADAFVIELTTPADVLPGGVVSLSPANFAQAPGAVGSDAIANDSGVAGDTVTSALDQLDTDVTAAQGDATQALADAAAAQGDATAALADAAAAQGSALAALTATSIQAPIADIISANAEVGAVDIYAGTITRISVIPNVAIAGGNLTVTFFRNGGGITGGVVTANNGAGALTQHVATPSAGNVCVNHDTVSWQVGGGNTAAGRATIRIDVDTTAP